MITDLPKSEDYKELGREWLLQSFDIVYDYSDELEYLSDWKETDWHFHKGKLSTVLVLLHQSIESVLKAEIIEVSPYLLIDMPPQNWPSLPQSDNKSYNQLFTINSEALLRLFCATCRTEKDKSDLVELFEEIRIKRNQIVHGLHKEILQPEYLIETQFKAAKLFYEESFWTLLKNEEKSHPLYNELEDEDLKTELYYKIKLISKYLSSRKFQNFIDLQGRGYFCPDCTKSAQEWDFRSVFLKPNRPDSTTACCIICDSTLNLMRENCQTEDCPGNVIHVDQDDICTCLTCLEDYEPND